MYKNILCVLSMTIAGGAFIYPTNQDGTIVMPLNTENLASGDDRSQRQLVGRTLKLLSESSNSMSVFEYLALQSNQRSEFQQALDEYKELSEKLENIDDSELKKLLEVNNLPSSKHDREYEIRNYKKRIELQLINKISGSLLEVQRKEIVKWEPESLGGLPKTLTETPIGEALGLTTEQQDELRKGANEIGQKLFNEYVKSRLEAEKLFAGILTEVQIKKLHELYAPGNDSKYFLIQRALNPRNIISELTYSTPKEALAKLEEESQFDFRSKVDVEERNRRFGN